MADDGSSVNLTFLFTDLESSTRLWERFPEAMKPAMERHDAILREAVEHFDGRVVKTTGDGMMAVLSSPSDGVAACVEAQRGLAAEPWGETGAMRVRMGLHAGEAQPRAADFYGPPVNRAARIMAAAHGGQVLLSALAAQLATGRLPAGVTLRDLGEHRLKDLLQPERIFELVQPGISSEFPPLATLSQRPNNLPTQTSEFLGRAAELGAIRALLDSAGVRLLTLTGPGGIGKTRLALQAAADQIDRFEDGLYFVDLAPTRDPEAAFGATVRAVGLIGRSDERPLELLKEQLRPRHMLLLLDNFEQVMEAAGGVADLLRVCPDLKVLVTSREALRVRGERLSPVPPLSLPDDGGSAPSFESIAGSEAVRLFVERAREARPSFALTEDNVAAVAEVCARLDGLPLAIELAAARLKLFSPHELRDRLRTRLELLRGGPRDLPARQQTLRSTIAWSYELLDGEERAMFQVLSVFSPTRVQAVEDVVARIRPLRGVDVVDRLTSLVDKSLVRSAEGPGQQRLSMLETIREYAAERLEEQVDLSGPARRAHAEHFAEFVHLGQDRLFGSEREEALDELGAEIGNLVTAWRYWIAAGDLEQLNKLLDGLWVFYDARGWYHAAVELMNDLLGVLSATPSTSERVLEEITLRASLARGLLAIRGYTEEVEEAYGMALALSEEAGGLPQLFPVLRSLASFYMYRAEFDKGAAVGRQLLDLAGQPDMADVEVDGHLVLGANLAFLGDVPAALEHLDRAIASFDPHQQRSGRLRLGPSPGVVSYTTSALLLWRLGYPDRAVERAAGGLELARRLNHPFTLAYALFHVGFLDLWRQELELVHERASGVLKVAEEHNYQIWKAIGMVLQGLAITGLGRPEEGLARTEAGIALYQGMKTPPVFWPLVLSIRARVFLLGGRPAEGLGPIDEALEMTGERATLYAEFALLRGDLLVALHDPAGAEFWLQSAFDASGRTGARMLQLSAANRLTHLWRASGRRPDGSEILRGVYQTFTEGFASAELVEARALLDFPETP